MTTPDMTHPPSSLEVQSEEVFGDLGPLEEELAEALNLYWTTAQDILAGSGITLLADPAGGVRLEDHFFSGLFLYSYHRAGIPRVRRVLYASLNQCLRGIVTGCDNLLDDEYKRTLETNLPPTATRFRSVIDIITSDRVLFSLLMAAHRRGELSLEQVLQASTASLHALTASGIQESTEEHGVASILPPQEILSQVHHYKTGLLFQCPWGIPAVLEPRCPDREGPLLDALYRIGMGCQILDDMVDLARDTREGRHNYVAALICHGGAPAQRELLERRAAADLAGPHTTTLLLEFPRAREEAAGMARRYLQEGLTALFDPRHRVAVEPALTFLCQRIGAEHLMAVAGLPA